MTRSPHHPTTPPALDPAFRAPAGPSPSDAPHQHGWVAESRHTTSDGICVYVRCDDCGARRVDLQEHPWVPPRGCSIEVGPPSTRSTP